MICACVSRTPYHIHGQGVVGQGASLGELEQVETCLVIRVGGSLATARGEAVQSSAQRTAAAGPLAPAWEMERWAGGCGLGELVKV